MHVDLVGHTLDARYKIDRCIGSGGMGSVWRAQHVQSLQYFAVKTLYVSEDVPDGAVRRCLKEARAAAQLRSRNVVRITDVQANYWHDNHPLPYVVMELLEGMDFESVLMRRGALDGGEVAWVINQTCRGVRVAHDQGIVHRDLKPSNLFLSMDEDGEPITKVCDFGLAKRCVAEAAADMSTTATGMIVGTPRYMAPEQFRDGERIATTTDQWAIGLIAYRLLTGRDYFEGAKTALELSLRVVHDDLPLPSSCSPRIPADFDAWFLRSCAREPERRFADVTAQARALNVLLGHPRPIALGTANVDTVAPVVPAARSRGASMRRAPSVPRRAFYAALALTSLIAVLGAIGLRRVLRVAPPAAATSGAITPTAARDEVSLPATSALEATSAPGPPRATTTPSTAKATERRRPRRAVEVATTVIPSTADKLSATKLAAGMVCRRSAECVSALCVAERCR